MQARRSTSVAVGIALAFAGAAVPGAVAQDAPPRILLDQSQRAVDYQLNRLTNDELRRVERQPTDPKYRPVYLALLTRTGMSRAIREDSLAVLTKMDGSSTSQVLLQSLARLRPEQDADTADQLLDMLFSQPGARLRGERELFVTAAAAQHSFVIRAGYGALMIVDDDPAAAWEAASSNSALLELLRVVPRLGTAADLRARLFAPVSRLLDDTPDPVTRSAAITALGWTRRDAATFNLLAREIVDPSRRADMSVRSAAVASMQLMPEAAWPSTGLEPLARALVMMIREAPSDRRTEPAYADAARLGERIATLLPDEARRAVRRDIRALGVRVVTVGTIPEQLLFDLRWFVVEAGTPVQIVLANTDGMPHNLVVGLPGSIREIGTAGSAMPLPTDATTKAYVPAIPQVVAATRLLSEGEIDRLSFAAPPKPGEYVFVCTVPGHWMRMYGVMLVVDNLEAWEAAPTQPSDPMTGQPFGGSRR